MARVFEDDKCPVNYEGFIDISMDSSSCNDEYICTFFETA
jgi:hypothetical protein